MKQSNKGFTITKWKGTIVFGVLEVILPATLIIHVLIHFHPDPSGSIVVASAKGGLLCAWFDIIIIALVEFITGRYKKIIFGMSGAGITFSQNGYLYEYDWDEIEYIRQNNIFERHLLFIKVYGREKEYVLNLELYMYTFIPIRMAFRRYGEGRSQYYTKSQWKRHQAENSKPQ